jgi:drug/metabolite transporter (DMT)-like permease
MKVIIVFLFMISCTVIANLLLKTGASGIGFGEPGLIHRLFSWRIMAGLGFFGAAALLYLLILSWIPLNVAQSFTAAQFVLVILASWVVLSEPINLTQWVGIALITIGIIVVGYGLE